MVEKFPGLTVDDILDMDPWHVPNIYFHPRDKDGSLMVSAKPTDPKPRSQKDWWLHGDAKNPGYARLDLPAWFVEAEWEKLQETIRKGKEMMAQMKAMQSSAMAKSGRPSAEVLAGWLDQRARPNPKPREDEK